MSDDKMEKLEVFCPDCGTKLEKDSLDSRFYWCSECDKDFILLAKED